MTTITLKINEKSQAGKMLKDLIEFFSKDKNDVEIIIEDSPYHPEFVKKIKEAEEHIKDGKTTRINPEKVWESIL